MVAPVIAAAGIGAASQLLGGLLQQKALEEQERKKREFEAQQQAFATQAGAQESLASGQIGSLQNLVESFRAATQAPRINFGGR